jgi:hypothetical protein
MEAAKAQNWAAEPQERGIYIYIYIGCGSADHGAVPGRVWIEN